MKVFSTEYAVGKTMFSSFVHAADRKTAEQYIKIRGIGEIITGQLVGAPIETCPLPSNLYRLRKLLECSHCLMFYGWIAGHFMDLHDQLLRDDGVLHEVMHEMQHPEEHKFRPLIFDRLEDLEKLIPGLKTFDQGVFEVVVAAR